MEVAHVTSGKKHRKGTCEVSMLSFLCPRNQEGNVLFCFVLLFSVSLDP